MRNDTIFSANKYAQNEQEHAAEWTLMIRIVMEEADGLTK